MGKLLERHILHRLNLELDDLDVLREEQVGFRQKLSTVQQALRLSVIIQEAIKHKDVALATFLDISKAFDKVWHHALLYKMSKMGFRINILKIIVLS